MRLVAVGGSMLIPMFSARDPLSHGVRLSYLLPPPTTLLGAFGSGLGLTLGIPRGECPAGGRQVRDVLRYALEESALAIVKPEGPIIKSAQMWKLVNLEKESTSKSSKKESERGLHDAFEAEYISSSKIGLTFIVDLDLLSEGLSELASSACADPTIRSVGDVGLGPEDLVKAITLMDRLGSTENLGRVTHASLLSIKNVETSGLLDSCVPLEWIQSVEAARPHESAEQIILPVNRFVSNRVRSAKADKIKGREWSRVWFLAPLRPGTKRMRGKRIPVYEPAPIRVQANDGYVVATLEDPKGELRFVTVLPEDIARELG